ncbi:homogentisate 1,2-dioxygenase [Sphingopyxis sp.]|uniref:homogentisate 1,2-dioxygenase n=1 Tax=Sphingopyxis sp. TaxID=1908224 RepID=UPI002D79B4DD|nr:homogentisate 1,2-dioxygenase [Sphingopyxis sp.]HET6527029.1 homogentisate 1,2-dioxygenase [Sphingopyxis sp.]
MGIRIIAAALTSIAFAASVSAAPPAKEGGCPAAPVLPDDLVDWSRDASGKTIYAYGDDLGADWLPLGAARTALPLHRFESLRYGVAPERKPDVHKFGGMIPIEVKRAGRLIVALDAGAWIDLVRDGAAVKSVTHGHGPACSGIRKMVEFDVTQGRYQLQIVNAPAASIHAMAVVR